MDDSNVHKIAKMIGLVFEGSLEGLIIFNHLCSEIAIHSDITDFIDVKRFTERMTALVGKLEI